MGLKIHIRYDSFPKLVTLKAGFLNLGRSDIFSWTVLWCGDCLVHCRMFTSIPSLNPLDADSTALHTTWDDQKCIQTLSHVPWRGWGGVQNHTGLRIPALRVQLPPQTENVSMGACECSADLGLAGLPGVPAAQTPVAYLHQLRHSRSSKVREWFGVKRTVGLPFLKPQHNHFLKAGRVYLKADCSWTFQKTDFHANLNARKIWINEIKFWINSWPLPLASFIISLKIKGNLPPFFPIKWSSLNSVYSQKRVTWVNPGW